ncbi:MAG: metallophosphoesterase [Planctomycetota bacterium]
MVASIQYIENVITTFQQATEANLKTPGREGNIVVLTPELADDVMITGDVHGHRRNFNFIRNTAALDRHPRRHLILQEVCHGGPTYPQSGGDMSHTVLEDVAALKVKYPDRVHFILGNHELAEISDYPIQKNKQMLNLMFRLGLQHMYGPAADKVREAFTPFLKSCPLGVRLPHGIFVSHSIPENSDTRKYDKSVFSRALEPLDFVERTGVFQLVWGRDYRSENADAFAELVGAQVLINGHEPCEEGFMAPNSRQVILDCCGDKPSYVVLDTSRPWSQQEILAEVKRLGAK